MKLSTYSYPPSVQDKISQDDYQALLDKADEIYGILEKLYNLYQQTLDDDIYVMYIQQLIAYTRQVGRIRSINPEFIKLKCQDVLDEAARLWAEHMFKWGERNDNDGNKILVVVDKEDGLTPEVVARHMFLLDTAQALGWEPPEPVPTPTTGIRCFKSLQQFVDGKVKKVGYCKLAKRHMLSACIFEPKYCRYYEEVR